ncbi:MAG: phytanoyl-CoA dioxygenase family protein [Chloroflexi bacterium]|nr:phytanoyl-CoA dioxygenase family protein [Chloroflexota bacterium]
MASNSDRRPIEAVGSISYHAPAGGGASTGMEGPSMEAPSIDAMGSPPAASMAAAAAPTLAKAARNGAPGVSVPSSNAAEQSAPPRWKSGATSVAAPESDVVTQEWLRPERIATEFSENRQRYRVSVGEYVGFHEAGFLLMKGLLTKEEVDEIKQHSEDLLYGRVQVPSLPPPDPNMTPEDIERRFLRIHMLHRHLEFHERYLLHPRVLDVVEALIGPDVMAMQTMFFIKAPGGAGQGYHQDSYYIPTYPDTLCGAWIAVDRADEENGCVWFTPGSQHEPIYPTEDRARQNHSNLADLTVVRNVSHPDTEVNTLARIAEKYPGREVPGIAEPGDVLFFGGHILHRSHQNRSQDRFRRAFVSHYANARAFTMWGSKNRREPANHLHLLARGWTHLPFAVPRFGTPCAANQPRPQAPDGGEPMPMAMMGDSDKGEMQAAPQDPKRNDPGMMRSHEADAHQV